MEHYINIIFNKNITLKGIEETVNIISDTGSVPLTENQVEYEIFKENNSRGITIPLASELPEHKLVEFVNTVANKLFDKGYNDFDIEVGLNEAERLTTFEPWRAEIEAAGYTITPSGTNIKARDGGTVAGINDNGNLWSGSRTITDIVRGNRTAQPAATAAADTPAQTAPTGATAELQGNDALQQFAQSDERGIANNPEQRTAIRQLQQKLIDLDYDLGPMGADGIYGRRTREAIRAYQQANNLTVDGDAGPETIGHILDNDSQAAADAAIDRRMDGDAAATRGTEEPQVDTDMTEQEATQELRRRLEERDYRGALAIIDAYPSIRASVSDENYRALQQRAGVTGDSESEPTDTETPDAEGTYVRNGDVVVGDDVTTKEDGSRQRVDWSLNIPDRSVTFTNIRNRLYESVYIREVEGYGERVAGIRNGAGSVINTPLPNLVAAIKEFIEDYNTRPGGGTVTPEPETTTSRAPDVQTSVEQPPTPEVEPIPLTGRDTADIPEIQRRLGNPPALPPVPEPGETSANTGIRNPVTYGTAMVNGIPNIVYQSLSMLGDELSVRNAEAFRDTLNFEILNDTQARSIVRELDRLYPLTDLADEILRNPDLPQEEKDAINILLATRLQLIEFNSDQPESQTEQDLEQRWDELRNSGNAEEITDFMRSLSSSEKISLGIDPLASTASDLDLETDDERGDGGLSIARLARDVSREINTNLGNARFGFGTDEVAIQQALQRIINRSQYDVVAGVYADRYPAPRRNNLRTGTMLGDLRGAMSERDWNKYVQPELDRLEIQENYAGPIETANESINTIKVINEETYDGNDFYEAYGDLWFNEDEIVDEAEYQGRKVKLGKPMRGDVKKFKVYVKNPKGNIVKVNFGDPDMKIKKSNPARRKSFRARHNCDNPGPRHKARYWSCRKW